MQHIAPTFFIIKNVVKIKNVKNVKKRDINKKRKNVFLHLWFVRIPKTAKTDFCSCTRQQVRL